MQEFFKSHPEFVLIGLAAIFLALLALSFIWDTSLLVSELGRAGGSGGAGQAPAEFDLKGAAALDLKGLVH